MNKKKLKVRLEKDISDFQKEFLNNQSEADYTLHLWIRKYVDQNRIMTQTVM